MPPLAPDEQLLLFPIPSGGTLTPDERGTPVSPEELRRRVGEELGPKPGSESGIVRWGERPLTKEEHLGG